MAEQNADAILARLSQLHPRKIDLSLERIDGLLEKLGRPERRAPPVIHVAGTNGKGSTIAFLRAMLEASGRRVHVYTSPHLVRFNERIRLAGQLVDDARLSEAFARCELILEGQPITLFEAITAVAFELFASEPADYLLLEVGLGGRFDATNVISRPLAALIAPVSHDHQEFLGSKLAGIAKEKAGILKKDAPGVIARQEPEALRAIEREARLVGAPLIVEDRDFTVREEHGRLVYEDRRGLLDLPTPRLVGRHQHHNAALAIACLRTLAPDFPADAIERGLSDAEWPGRLQRIARGPLVRWAPADAEIWLDGAHNEAGGEAAAAAMAELEERSPRPLILICGMLKTKDAPAFLRHFRGLAQEALTVGMHSENAAPPEALAAAAREAGLAAAAFASVKQALEFLSAREWREPPRILIAGSLVLAGEMLALSG